MRYYDEIYWDAESVERYFLYLLDLFDRPMSLAEKEVLFKHANFAQPLAQLSSKAFKQLIKQLTQ